MSKQPSRRGRARAHSLRTSAYVLLVAGLLLVVAALASPHTRLEAAGGGLLLIGVPLLVLGCGLMGLDWMASYTATSEGTWDHHAKASAGRTASLGFERSRFDGNSIASSPASAARSSRPRSKRSPLFGRSLQSSAFAVSMQDAPFVEPGPPPTEGVTPKTAVAAPAAAPGAAPAAVAAPAAAAAVQRAVAAPAPAAVVKPVSTPAPAPAKRALPQSEPEPKAGGMPGYLGRVDPGPDTVIEEFVGYEGQDRMLVVREAPEQPPPRELAWPNPPRPAFDATATGNQAFLEKLTDDMLTKIGTPAAPPPAALAPAPPAPPAWTRQTLHNADHWRFAAMVEKLYQQAGFATQLQAGQTMRGVVVLWLFSRHRPGMPASVVSCVHGPGDRLVVDEIIAVAELVKTHGLPRGQLATTATVDAAGRELAAQHRVHLMDTQRLLELINQRTVEQQRTLADRLA